MFREAIHWIAAVIAATAAVVHAAPEPGGPGDPGDDGLVRIAVTSDAAITSAYPSLARLDDDRLFCVFSRVAPGGEPMTVAGSFSSDHGRTWSEPVTLLRDDDAAHYDPSLVVIGPRVLVMSTTVDTKHGNKIVASRTTVIASEDGGRTWSPPEVIPMHRRYTSGKVNNGLVLRDGSVLFGFTWEKNLETTASLDDEGQMEEVNAVMISRDAGRTWTPGGSVGLDLRRPENRPDAINGLCEPAILERRDGSLLMLSRTGLDRLHQCVSQDGGVTWSPPEPSIFVSHNAPAALCRFTSEQGDGVLVVWNHSPTDRWPLSVAATFDDGRTWTQPRQIARRVGFQSSYPACAQAADGSLVVVYQQDTQAGPRQIVGVRFASTWLNAVVHEPNVCSAPAPRTDPSSTARHQQINERAAAGDADVIFVGDSLTHRWESTGAETWRAYYGKRRAVNMGSDGDGTQSVLWRLNNGNLKGISPRVAVVLIGSNNSTDPRQTPEMIASGIAAIVSKLRHELPDTRVLLLDIFPRFDYSAEMRARTREASRLASRVADGEMVVSLDIAHLFAGPDGEKIPELLTVDSVHLSAAGYRLWAEAMEPTLRAMLNKEAPVE